LKHLLKYIALLCAVIICLCSCDFSGTVDLTQTSPNTTIADTELSPQNATTEANTTSSAETTSLYSEPYDNTSELFTSEHNHNFFDDAVFVGDSVTLGLKNRAVSQRNKGIDYLGSAQFLCAGSLNFYSTAAPLSDPDAVHPIFKGQKVTVSEGIRLSGAKKVFIMLGMNDFSAFNDKKWQSNVSKTIDDILRLSPGIEIYIQSVTPIASGFEHGGFNNKNLNEFNGYLENLCRENGFVYVDINSVLSDESGYLRRDFCGDLGGMGIHMSHTGADTWAEFLEETFMNNRSN